MIYVDNKKSAIHIYDIIGPDYFGLISDSQLVEALEDFRGEPVTVRINSPGGSAFIGVSMYKALQRHDGEVTTVIDGVAASAASIVFLAGSTRIAQPMTRGMIHEAWAFGEGFAEDFQRIAGLLRGISDDLGVLYAERTNMSEDEALKAMAAETWYSADQLYQLGFATEKPSKDVTGPENIDKKVVPQGWYKHTPKDLLKPEAHLRHIKRRSDQQAEPEVPAENGYRDVAASASIRIAALKRRAKKGY